MGRATCFPVVRLHANQFVKFFFCITHQVALADPNKKRGGGGTPPDSALRIFILPEQAEANPRTVFPLKPFVPPGGSDLLHSTQQGWECLLLAFRAAIRARVPSMTNFVDDLDKSNQVLNAAECAESGIPLPVFRFWLSRFCPNFALQLIRRHPWSSKSVVQDYFAKQVTEWFSRIQFLTECLEWSFLGLLAD